MMLQVCLPFAVTSDMVMKPCTKIQYQSESTYWPRKSNVLELRIVYPQPSKVTVKEEYLIYDLVLMIGAIGGTMGLCIGFSFADVFASLIQYTNLMVDRCKKSR